MIRRTVFLAILVALGLSLTAGAAFAGGNSRGDDAEITADFSCTSIEVESTKALSNVVLQFTDGSTERFEQLGETQSGTFSGDGDNAGKQIARAWVKSGNNASGDGPGFGERFDSDAVCEQSAPGGEGSTGTSAEPKSNEEEPEQAAPSPVRVAAAKPAAPATSPRPTRVLGVKLTKGVALPNTGSSSRETAVAALALISIGMGLVLLAPPKAEAV